ncbi:MAG: TadE/TadG family type IV pilus assembly protein [Planctomycetota bacterium]|nr:TadE/TadG family type IV pilus assembly protein [Planctomycetota bacterium]MDA1177628.1 TadE/TadG family type IV pilus assembly protein [Planctomycetota bacterium]
MKRYPASTRRHRRGISIVELSLFLPVIILIALGTLETCSMIYLKQSLEIAAYEGARVSVNPSSTAENVEGQCLQILSERGVIDAEVTITPENIPGAPVGSFLQVSVTAPCADNSLFGNMFYSSKTLNGSVEMMKEF